jgi:hypothetical protein
VQANWNWRVSWNTPNSCPGGPSPPFIFSDFLSETLTLIQVIPIGSVFFSLQFLCVCFFFSPDLVDLKVVT